MGAIVSLSALKAYLPVSVTTDDDFLEDLIYRAEEYARSYCSRELTSKQFTEKRSGHGSDILLLKEFPVTAVTSVTIGSAVIPASTSAGYEFSEEAIYLHGYRFTKGVRNVTVVYTAGYLPALVPFDLRQAVLEIAALSYRRRDHLDVATKAMAAESTTYITQGLTPSARETLQNYMRVTPL